MSIQSSINQMIQNITSQKVAGDIAGRLQDVTQERVKMRLNEIASVKGVQIQKEALNIMRSAEDQGNVKAYQAAAGVYQGVATKGRETGIRVRPGLDPSDVESNVKKMTQKNLQEAYDKAHGGK